jgi:hypothetical protein
MKVVLEYLGIALDRGAPERLYRSSDGIRDGDGDTWVLLDVLELLREQDTRVHEDVSAVVKRDQRIGDGPTMRIDNSELCNESRL